MFGCMVRSLAIEQMKRDAEEDKAKHPESYQKRCHLCGKFVRREQWVLKDLPNNRVPMCTDCVAGIDTGTMGY